MPQVHFIQLTEDTMCAHDRHELTHYPRPWFKAKPTLHTGAVLEVKEIFTNFYGQYYKCETKDGVYDIPVENAKDVSVDFQMTIAESYPWIKLQEEVDNLKRALDDAYGPIMRKILIKVNSKGWDGLLKIIMPICVLIRQIRKGGEK